MSKHTPGPWLFTGFWGDGEWAVEPIMSKCQGCDVEFEGTEADARLIAAAPDMLLALIELAAYVDAYPYGSGWAGRPHQIMDAARAAITKATEPNA